jgi:ABC-type uncharacterized transport system permease subunit
MRSFKPTRIQLLGASLLIVLVLFGIAVIPSLSAGEGYRLGTRLSNALLGSVLLVFVGWFAIRGASRQKIFGLVFALLGLLILTVPLRLQSSRLEAERIQRAVDAILEQMGEDDTIPRQEAVAVAAEALDLPSTHVEALLDSSRRLSGADPLGRDALMRAGGDAQASLDGVTLFSPEAISILRYGDFRQEAPASSVPTRLWLIYTGISFLLGGLAAIFLPASLNEWVQTGLSALILLILTPAFMSVWQAVIAVLENGALRVIPPVVWWVIGVAGFLAVVGSIAYSNRQRESFPGGAWLVVNGVLLLPTVLIAASVGKQTNVLTMFAESLRLATPIVIGAIAGLWSERSGVVNIAIEGMMLTGACFGFTTFFFLGEVMPDTNLALFISVMIAILSGGIMSLLHGWLSITFKTNQIVSGTVINILAIGLTSFVRRQWLLSTEAGRVTLPSIPIPGLVNIPLIGPVLFNNKPIFYAMFILLIVTYYVIFHTSWGLRIRAVGEHPHAADTVGINVFRVRYIAVLISGLIAGMGGAWFSLETVGGFDDMMTSGRGFIALAAMIFGKWTPFGAFFGGLLFGFADALGTRFQILNVPVPPQFLQILPYLTTMVVLAGLIGRAVAPAADGKPYEK